MISIIVMDIVVYCKLQSGPQVSYKRCSDRNTDAEPWRESNQEKVRYKGEKTIRKK